MAGGWVAFMSAVSVALIGGPMMWLLRRLDRHNTEQHSESLEELRSVARIAESIDQRTVRLESRFDRHLEWHAED